MHRLESLATGNWRGANCDMPARYAGEKTDTARTVKLLFLYVLRRALREGARPITWATLRACSTPDIVEAARKEALVSLAADQEVKATAQERLVGLVAPRKKFKMRGLKFRRHQVPPPVDKAVSQQPQPVQQQCEHTHAGAEWESEQEQGHHRAQ